jgi:hypothetical protein
MLVGAMSEQRREIARFYLPLVASSALLLAAFFVVEFAAPARALPSYARQTGQPCGTLIEAVAAFVSTLRPSRGTPNTVQ